MKSYSLYFIIIICCTVVFDGHAQRRKKTSNAPTEISEDTGIKGESTFIEAEKQILLENYAKAYDLLLTALDLSPDNAAIYFKLAEVHNYNGEVDKSLEAITKAIDLSPDNKYYYMFKGELLKSNNRFADAADLYERLIDRIPGNEEYYYDLATIYQFQGSFDKALEYYGKAEDHFGISYSALVEKQKIYLRKNDMQSLIADWEKLIDENTGEPEYVLELCNILMVNDMSVEADKRLSAFNEEYPNNANGYLLQSEIARKNGDYAKALKLLEKPLNSPTVEITPKIQLLNQFIPVVQNGDSQEELLSLVQDLTKTHPDSYQAFAFSGDMYLQLGKEDTALYYYLKSTEMSPANFTVWQNIVNIEAQKELYDSLIVHSEQALEYFPNQSLFYYYNGFAHYIQKNHKRAAASLEMGKKYTSDPSLLGIFYGQLGDVYNSLKDHEKSDQSYEEALKIDPDNDHVLNNYSYFLSIRGVQLDKAFEMSSKLVEKHPENGTYLDTHGWVLYMRNDYVEAEKYIRKAMDVTEDGTIIEHYGDILFKLGDVEKAIEYWERAKEVGGTSDEIEKKIEDRMIYE
jgi:tetratricopeptide (TPR) repeat protein